MSVINYTQTFTADGQSKLLNVPVSADYMFYAVGDFGGGVIALESSPDNGVNWFTVDQLNTAGRLIRYLVDGERLRLTLSGSSGANVTTGIR